MKKHLLTILAISSLLLASCGGSDDPVKPDETAPAVPTGLALHTATETSLSFQWTAVDGAAQYDWKLLSGGKEVQSSKTSNRNVIINGLTKATDYQFAVRSVAFASSGEKMTSGWSSYVDARTQGTVDPEPEPAGKYYEQFKMPAAEEGLGALAFPGAEGGGMYTTGGRGGKVLHVTNLEDSGEGSLRWAVGQSGARTVVFDVAGVIELKSTLTIYKGDLTIAGQTAPGDGICLKNYTLRINASNVIVRFIRCRMGDEKATEDDAMNLYTHENNIKDVIIDHCSLSWSTDECGSFYGMTGFSLQWCILSESLRNSVHDKGKHGYGGIWGGANATYHHNLLAHHDSRNPRLDHDYVSTLKGPVSLVNNVVYNWGDNSTYGGESANDNNTFRQYNIVNNYYKPGPATASGKIRFIDPWTKACDNCSKTTGSSTIVPGHFYMSGNCMHGDEGRTKDNWTGTTASATVIGTIRSTSPFVYKEKESSVSLHSAENAFGQVLSYAGASLKRDAVDTRVTKETREGTFTYSGSNGSGKGFIDTQSDVGGWPAYEATGAELTRTKDTDKDGLPDWLEDQFGLDKSKAADAAAKTLDKNGRYSNLEMYLHYLVRDIVAGQNASGTYTKL